MNSFELIAVFTGKSLEKILAAGGTSSWRLNRSHARLCPLVVCTRNAHSDVDERPGQEAHGSGFLVGRIKDVIPSPTEEDRWLIEFSEYAKIDAAGVWKGERNPVKYLKSEELSALGIDFEKLQWQPMPEAQELAKFKSKTLEPITGALTIAQAKRGLALNFGVPSESVEITIRG